MNKCVCAITGHRPSRFKFKYSEDYTLCKKIKANMLEVFRKLYDEKIATWWIGPTTWWQFMTMCGICDPGQCSVSDMHERTMFR